MKPVLFCFVVAVSATGLAQTRKGNVGSWDADVLPDKAKPAWRLVSGKASESIVDGKWVIRSPKNFCRKVDFGPIAPTEGQKNFVEFSWATDCKNNLAADGFSVSTQGRRFRLHPICRPNGDDLLLTGDRGGMAPDRKACHVDLSALDEFDATKLNRYRIRWVTAADDKYGFELSVNGKRIGLLPGEIMPNSSTALMAFEFRSGTHRIDSLRWQLNHGGTSITSRRVRAAQILVAKGCRQLFLDDVMVHKMKGLRRVVHQPKKYAKNPMIRHHQKPWQTFRAQLYGTVLYIPEEKRFKMWYLAGPRFPKEKPIRVNGRLVCPNFQLLGYAESKDGFHWELPDLGLVDFNGSKKNNLCRISRENAEGVAVVYDPSDRDPKRRYKAFYWEHDNCGPRKFDPVTPVNAMSVSFSADGKAWTNHPGNPVIGLASDTGHQALWDPSRKKYVVYGRFGAGGRKIARSESDDFIRWSPPKLVFQTDGNDGRGAQFYGMGISLYEGIYVGLPWMFRQGTTDRIDVQLAASRDGISWKRAGDQKTFIPNGPKGNWDGGCIFTAAQPIQRVGDTIYIFYSGTLLNHEEPRPSRERHPEYGESSIGVATLRRDGFVSLAARETPGVLVTESFEWPKGRELHLNADASQGEISVAGLDEEGREIAGLKSSKPLTGNQLDQIVTWPGGAVAAGRTLRLRITLRNAEIFSWWLDAQVP